MPIARVRDIHWIWSEVMPPYIRYVVRPPDCPDDGHLYCVYDDIILGHFLRKEYERQVRTELIDPEWPSPYWDAICDYRDNAQDFEE